MKSKIKLNLEEQSEILAERFGEAVKDGFGALILLWAIKEQKKASSKEIKEFMRDFFNGRMEYSYTSFYRLLAKLRDDFGLIKEVEKRKARGPKRSYYSLTPLGRLVLKKIITRYINPLKEVASPK